MRLFFFVCLIIVSSSVFSQDCKSIYFEDINHNFGTIKEVNGVVEHIFSFINRGEAPIIIKNVETSCGCTSVQWTKAPVLPLKSGYIKIQFDPINRPGNFNKTITVITNCNQSNTILKIHGNVEPKIKTELDNFPYEFSTGIRFQYDCLAFMRIKHGESKFMKFNFYNNSTSNMQVSFAKLPSNIKIIDISNNVKPRKTGNITIKYYSSIDMPLGLYSEELYMLVNGKKEPIIICADIKEDFSNLSQAELSAAPRISVDRSIFDFGEKIEGDIINTEFKISNKGETNLIIKRIYSSNKFSFTLPEYTICPNCSSILNVALSTIGLKDRQNIVIRVITNDPYNQEIKLRFIGNIK